MDGMTERAMCEPETMARSSLVRRHMRLMADKFRDPLTGEVSPRRLAEATAATFDLYDDSQGKRVPDALYEVACELAHS